MNPLVSISLKQNLANVNLLVKSIYNNFESAFKYHNNKQYEINHRSFHPSDDIIFYIRYLASLILQRMRVCGQIFQYFSILKIGQTCHVAKNLLGTIN